MSKTILGIDVGSKSLSVAYKVQDEWHFSSVPNEWLPVQQWANGLQNELGACHAIVEFTGKYSRKVVTALQDGGVPVTMLTPGQSRAFARLQHRTTKNDRTDACALASYGTLQGDHLQVYTQQSDTQIQRRELLSYLDQLEKSRQQVLNQRHDHLQNAPRHRQELILRGYDAQLTTLDGLIQQAQEEHRQLDEQDAQFTAAAALMQTVKGIGKKTVDVFLTFIGLPTRFDNPKQISKYVGTAPTEYQSGTSVRGRGRINRTGVARVRHKLYCCTWSAVRFNKACKQTFERLTGRGKSRKEARIAVVNLLIRQLFAVVKSGIAFDNDWHSKKAIAQ